MAWYDVFLGPGGRKIGSLGDESASAIDKRNQLSEQGQAAGGFANISQDNFAGLGAEAYDARQMLRDRAMGNNSVTAEQLRQGLQSLYGQQRSAAASASPQNAAMAARTAMINSARLGSATSGQAALARLQEQRDAEKAYMDSLLGLRGQELQGALGSRSNAVNAFGGVTPDKSWIEKWGQPLAQAAGTIATSDERAKHSVKDADADAKRIMAGLKAYTFKYKDPKTDGDGDQFGVMAQDLERAGLKHAVIDMPDGKKAVHGAKLSTANTAMIAALGKRVAQLEGKRK